MPVVPIVSCLLAALLFGASTPASKILLGPVGPLTLAGLLYLGAALGVLPAALRKGPRRMRADPRNALRLAGAVVFGGVLGPVLLLWGLSRAPSASVALWLNLETVATAVLAWAVFRENVGARTWAAAGLVLAGSVLLASPEGFAVGLPALLVALACTCWGLDNNLTSLIDGFTPAQSTFVKGLVAGAVNLGLGLALEETSFVPAAVAGALGVGVLGYGLSLVLYVAGAQQLGAMRSQLAFATAPFWGVLLSWAVLGEPLTLPQAGAGALMLVALWLAHREAHAHRHSHREAHHVHAHAHDDSHHDHGHPGLPPGTWHTHGHDHAAVEHEHPHQPDVHHRHDH